MGLPKRQVVGDILVSGSGPFLYCNRALWNLSERVPPGPEFPAISRFMVFTATSARQFAWGWYADDILWCTPQLAKKALVVWEANSGPPSDVSVSGIPKVENVSLSVWVRPVAPSLDVVTTGQLEKRSTRTR